MNLIFFLLITANYTTTVQQSDELLIGDRVIKLQSYPLEELNLVKRPFGYTDKTAPNTSCWRGYKADWTIVNNKLYLKSINRCYGDTNKPSTANIQDLFNENKIEYDIYNNMIHAAWYSGEFVKIDAKFVDAKDRWIKINITKHNQESMLMRIENGKVIANNIHK